MGNENVDIKWGKFQPDLVSQWQLAVDISELAIDTWAGF